MSEKKNRAELSVEWLGGGGRLWKFWVGGVLLLLPRMLKRDIITPLYHPT